MADEPEFRKCDDAASCECIYCRIERAIWQGRTNLPAEEGRALKSALASHFGLILAQARDPGAALQMLGEFNADALAVMHIARAAPENAAVFAARDAAARPKH